MKNDEELTKKLYLDLLNENTKLLRTLEFNNKSDKLNQSTDRIERSILDR